MRRTLAGIFVVVLLLASNSAARADTVALTVPAAQSNAMEAAVVSLRVEKAQGLGALQVVVTYDPTAVDAGPAEAGALFSGLVESNVTSPGRLRVALVTSEGVEGDGELLRLRFTPKGKGATVIGLEDARAWQQASGHEMSVSTANGTLTIGGETPGGPTTILIVGGVLVALLVLLAARRRHRRGPAGSAR